MKVFKEGRGEKFIFNRMFGGGTSWKPKDLVCNDKNHKLEWGRLVAGVNVKHHSEITNSIDLKDCTVGEIEEIPLPVEVGDYLGNKDFKFFVITIQTPGEGKGIRLGYVDKQMIGSLREQILYTVEKIAGTHLPSMANPIAKA